MSSNGYAIHCIATTLRMWIQEEIKGENIIMWCSHQILKLQLLLPYIRYSAIYTHTCTVILYAKIGKGGLSLSLSLSITLKLLSFFSSFLLSLSLLLHYQIPIYPYLFYPYLTPSSNTTIIYKRW